MLFNSIEFVLFFACVLGLYRAAPPPLRLGVLLGSSLLFYFLWIPAYLLLLGATIGVNYVLLRLLRRRPGQRLLLAATVGLDLGSLAMFKYAAFAAAAVTPIWGGLTGLDLPIPELLLPLGISFYTFQIIALAVDTYRGADVVPATLSEYALFVCFFPQLIAGPILRHDFLRQIRAGGTMRPDWTRRGVWLIASGLLKKVVLADFLAAPFVDAVFGLPDAASSADAVVAVYCFAFQLYFDFSGYSDIARGLSRLLGFELPLNFREPYLSRNPSELWRRWHITLSTWLRDYLYIPLGGNRRGAGHTYVNLGLTMVLGGLWHGAAWTFVIWGALHGLWLALHRAGAAEREDVETLCWRDTPRIFLCFHAWCAILVFFRAPDVGVAAAIFEQVISSPVAGWPLLQMMIVAGFALLHYVERRLRLDEDAWLERATSTGGRALEASALGAVAALALILGGAAGGEFIYFQF